MFSLFWSLMKKKRICNSFTLSLSSPPSHCFASNIKALANINFELGWSPMPPNVLDQGSLTVLLKNLFLTLIFDHTQSFLPFQTVILLSLYSWNYAFPKRSSLNKPSSSQLISVNYTKMINSKRKKIIYANNKKKAYCSSREIYLMLYSQIKQTCCNHQNETSETTQNNSRGQINMNSSSWKNRRRMIRFRWGKASCLMTTLKVELEKK